MGDARFERHARLATKADFRSVFEQPEKSVDRYFTVLARPNGLGFARLGLAISRKSARSAVVRNRVKRVVRESFRLHRQALDSLDFVVIGRASLTSRDNAVFSNSLEQHWARLVRRCAKS